MLPTSNSKTTEELINISMANRPLAYTLSERKQQLARWQERLLFKQVPQDKSPANSNKEGAGDNSPKGGSNDDSQIGL